MQRRGPKTVPLAHSRPTRSTTLRATITAVLSVADFRRIRRWLHRRATPASVARGRTVARSAACRALQASLLQRISRTASRRSCTSPFRSTIRLSLARKAAAPLRRLSMLARGRRRLFRTHSMASSTLTRPGRPSRMLRYSKCGRLTPSLGSSGRTPTTRVLARLHP